MRTVLNAAVFPSALLCSGIFRAVLALPLLAGAAGAASAQTYAQTYPYADDRQVYRDSDDARYERNVHYDYAQVIRVDPVFYDGRDGLGRGQQVCYRRNAYGEIIEDDVYDDRYVDADGRDVRNDRYGNREIERRDDNGRTIATVVGGIAGAVLGSKIGDGSGRYVGSAVGTMVGGMAGRGIYDANRRARQPRDGVVTVCEPLRDGDVRDTRVYRDEDRSRYYGAADRRGGAYGDPDAGGINAYDVTYRYAGRDYVTRTRYHPGERIRIRVDVQADQAY